jgi:hypothetical protein
MAAEPTGATLGPADAGLLARTRIACAICARPANLGRTASIAAVVGVVLTLINQADVFLRGGATGLTWVKVGLNFLVPFCVSNLGLLAGRRGGQP